MRKLKYVKLFENFETGFKYFDPEVIENLNHDLYYKKSTDINVIMEYWINEIAELIKSVEPFNDPEVIQEMQVSVNENIIEVGWNNKCRPFTINFSNFGRIKSGSYEEIEIIRLEIDCSQDDTYPEIKEACIEYHFRKEEDSDTLSPDGGSWDDDAILKLFRNIELSVY